MKYLLENKIECIRLCHGIDPVSKNVDYDGLKRLLNGHPSQISLTKSSINKEHGESYNLIIQKGNKMKSYPASDIAGFIYGGFSSRFWLVKNFINL